MCFQHDRDRGPRLSRQLLVLASLYSFIENGHSKKKQRLSSWFSSNKYLHSFRSRCMKLVFVKLMRPSWLVRGTLHFGLGDSKRVQALIGSHCCILSVGGDSKACSKRVGVTGCDRGKVIIGVIGGSARVVSAGVAARVIGESRGVVIICVEQQGSWWSWSLV
jgi:hypothetical protein